jgi:IclR family KDG regulon transcriptional repressor
MDNTISKGLNILEILINNDDPMGVTEIAKFTGFNKSSTHRYLQTLVDLGYAASEDGKYLPTLKIWQLGSRIIRKLDLRRITRPVMDRLAKDTRETIHLAVLEGIEAVYIDKVDGGHSIRAFSEIGDRAPCHCSATGKIFLSYDESAWHQVMAEPRISYTDKSITSEALLQSERTKILEQGYATNFGEWEVGVGGVAAPIWNSSGDVIAAIGLVLPLSRHSEEQFAMHTSSIKIAAQQISKSMGYSK